MLTVFMRQWMRAIHPACHSRVSHLQGSHHVQDHHVHIVGGAESSVPTLGLNDDDRKFRHRRPTQRQSYSQNGPEEDGGPRPSRSRVVLASSREQVTYRLFALKHPLHLIAIFRSSCGDMVIHDMNVHLDCACLW